MKLTQGSIRTIALDDGQAERTFFDDTLAGFGVRVRAGGGRTFVVQYKVAGKNRRLVLGAVDALSLGKARDTARDILAAVRLGRDPFADRVQAHAEAAETFGGDLLARYLDHQRARLKPRSYVETERHLKVAAKPLHARPVQAIDRRAIASRLSEIAAASGPAAANRTRAALSAYFMWLAGEGLVDVNPVSNTNRAPENGERDRMLDDSELRAVWHAAGDDRYGAIVRMLALTAARRDEIASLRWSEVDLDNALIVLPPERVKNSRQHEIPLSPPALAILRAQPRASDFVFGGVGRSGFQGWSKSKAELDARLNAARKAAGEAPIAEWRLHDLRRTGSTLMHDRLGVAPHHVEAVLGHVSGHKAGVAGTYNRATYEREKRMALDQWAEHVMTIVEQRESKVVPLRA